MSRILVVDDDADIVDVVESALRERGHDVARAADGMTGLRSLGSLPFDAVILDVRLPTVDGWQALKVIRDEKQFDDVAVVMLSARSGDDALVRARELGSDDFVPKPFDIDELIESVEGAIAKRRKRTISVRRTPPPR